jgi:two-component system CheB/CheR fusion protein
MMTTDGAEFETFLTYLSGSRGFDFMAYKRASLQRRITKRMREVDADSYAEYTDFLQVHPDEFTQLFNTILINVTSFFRDPPAWALLSEAVIPRIIDASKGGAIRIWSAGCSSGEEPYSAAMAFAEAMGERDFRDRVKIYGTDVDEDALTTARQATYTKKQLEAVPEPLREKYFEPANGGGDYVLRKDTRRCVIFGRHDLLNDAPISRVDLLLCRNTLMYFNAEAQGRIISRFFFGLNPQGYLFLGKSETLVAHAAALTPVDLPHRIFTKSGSRSTRMLGPMAARRALDYEAVDMPAEQRLRASAWDAAPIPQITVDAAGYLIAVNHEARDTFGVSIADVGRPLQDIELSYRPAELRSLIEQAYNEGRDVMVRNVDWSSNGQNRLFDINIVPLASVGDDAIIGVNVLFADITRVREIEREFERIRHDLDTAYEERQSANEELETTNEELHSTVEELETTNEELQSTNEELETMNEELQSTNEELETVNAELNQSAQELQRLNRFLEGILKSMSSGVVVVSPDLTVQAWNHRAEDLWGLRADEVEGQHLMALDIGLPVNQLRQPIHKALGGDLESVRLSATNRRGRAIECDVHSSPLMGADSDITGVILMMEEASDGQPSGDARHTADGRGTDGRRSADRRPSGDGRPAGQDVG